MALLGGVGVGPLHGLRYGASTSDRLNCATNLSMLVLARGTICAWIRPTSVSLTRTFALKVNHAGTIARVPKKMPANWAMNCRRGLAPSR